MIDTNQWMEQYQKTVTDVFGSRILFIGLQGSYGRNEAQENSDIDVVLIFDTVSLADLDQYKQAIEALPHRPLLCGFVSGKEELANWHRADVFQFYHDTISYYGSLDTIIPALTDADTRSAIRVGACNLYHMCSHNYLHSGMTDILKDLYKSAFFVLQAKHYAETGHYARSHKALKNVLSGTDLKVLQYGEQVKTADASQIPQYSALLLQWTHTLICVYK